MTGSPRVRGPEDTTPRTDDDLLTGARSGLVRLSPAAALPARPGGTILAVRRRAAGNQTRTANHAVEI
jgi:hypothetical protein